MSFVITYIYMRRSNQSSNTRQVSRVIRYVSFARFVLRCTRNVKNVRSNQRTHHYLQNNLCDGCHKWRLWQHRSPIASLCLARCSYGYKCERQLHSSGKGGYTIGAGNLLTGFLALQFQGPLGSISGHLLRAVYGPTSVLDSSSSGHGWSDTVVYCSQP